MPSSVEKEPSPHFSVSVHVSCVLLRLFLWGCVPIGATFFFFFGEQFLQLLPPVFSSPSIPWNASVFDQQDRRNWIFLMDKFQQEHDISVAPVHDITWHGIFTTTPFLPNCSRRAVTETAKWITYKKTLYMNNHACKKYVPLYSHHRIIWAHYLNVVHYINYHWIILQ